MSSLALCIPAYNAAKFLPALFASVSEQSLPFNEILLYNDCSTDDTASLAKKLGATVISGRENKGCSFGKNVLATIATSEWIFFLDADDLLLPGFTQRAFEWINKNNESDLVLMKYDYIEVSTGKVLFTPQYDVNALNHDPVEFMIRNKIVNSSMTRRDKFLEIGGFDLEPSLLFIEDRAFSLRAATAGLRFGVDNVSSFVINCYQGSMSTRKPAKWVEAGLNLWKKVADQTGHNYSVAISEQLFENAAWAARYQQWKLVDRSLKLARKIAPAAKPGGGWFFQLLFSIHPLWAYRIRKYIMRLLKPAYAG